jgi:hypothetical protein
MARHCLKFFLVVRIEVLRRHLFRNVDAARVLGEAQKINWARRGAGVCRHRPGSWNVAKNTMSTWKIDI